MPPTLVVRDGGPVIESSDKEKWNWRSIAQPEDLVIESWSQGFIVGSLMLMGCITVANMRRGILLHKLILAEQMMALSHGTFCFMSFKGYGWYLSSTAALLYFSYIVHNVVAWMKVKPFFHGKSTIFKPRFVKWTTRIYLTTLCMTVPPILFQIADNFRYFNGYTGWYVVVRPYEPLMRDPWWVFCCGILFYVISKSYGMGVTRIIKKSPRFGILFVSIILAIIFTCLDIAASIHPFIGDTDGINPFWKLSLVFKCLTDAILLDDFKTELKRLGLKRIKRDEKRRESFALTLDDDVLADSDEDAAMHYSNGNIGSPALNGYARPSRIPRQNASDGEGSQHVEFMSALHTHPSQLSSDRESRRQSMQRPQVGQGGTPAAKLPRLFASIVPRKGSKKSVEQPSRNSSIWTQPEEPAVNREVPPPPPPPAETAKKGSRWMRRSRDAGDGGDEVQIHDDALEQARLEQARTIAELKQRKNSAVSTTGNSLSPNTADRVRQQRKKGTSNDPWHDIDDFDDAEEDEGPTSSLRPPAS